MSLQTLKRRVEKLEAIRAQKGQHVILVSFGQPEADADGLNYWQGQLTAGLSHADLLVNFSESNENQENVIALISNGIAYEQWMG